MKPVRIGLLGLGTVGGGALRVLIRNSQEIMRRAGRSIQVARACARDFDPAAIGSLDGITITEQPIDVITDPDIDIVVELFGGIEPARSLVMEAIANGKHVVTANKALIAHHGNEIFEAANENKVIVAFEAAVAGGIPIIKALREGLSANRIEWIAGIINGTGNFILTEMRDKGRTFSDVLVDAQQRGYAEADPAFDVEGTDAAHKLAILAAIAFGKPLQFDKVYTEGITGITPEDVGYAEQLGYRIKHLGIAKRTELGVELRVHPTLIPEHRLIANVDGVMNAILVKGNAVGPTLYYGAGAGAEPTASAVVADLIDITRTLTAPFENRIPYLAFQPDAVRDIPILPMTEVTTAYYLRILAADQPGVLGEVANIFGKRGISIEAVVQKEPHPGVSDVSLIMLTHRVLEGRMMEAIAEIEKLDSIGGGVTRIRMEQLRGE
uniref:Homoserine dehydrogenase n=1 Tax=Candidatus Kentrum sp. MB TaxID=2138164 RepID=A0A451BCZ0_9GAMM|nr:MAG: homoserine dehydrogenase [Candidatus Kentron sp. MB]VFK33416.1 MAG: homoserine dehydrogenase [Candidatus Kentron sp. MB]VFK76157.1 MAG: homoserine dehydrogenase [Candidatus Kentron sp. MB]